MIVTTKYSSSPTCVIGDGDHQTNGSLVVIVMEQHEVVVVIQGRFLPTKDTRHHKTTAF